MTITRGPAGGRALLPSTDPPKPYYVITESGCWEWSRAKSPGGYGLTRYGGQSVGAHRAFFAHYVAPIPAGRVVMHTCDNPGCVNPDHLVLGTVTANMADKRSKGRANTLRGEANGWAKLTSADVVQVFEMRASGLSQRAIAKAFDVSQVCISNVLSRKRHATVDIPANLIDACRRAA